MPSNKQLVRRTPLDGFKPKDFSADQPWPEGPITLPPSFVAQGFDPDELKSLTVALMELREVILAFEALVNRDRARTYEGMARKLGVSDGTLRAIRRGDQFPSWRVYAMLRAVAPPLDAQDAKRMRGMLVPPASLKT